MTYGSTGSALESLVLFFCVCIVCDLWADHPLWQISKTLSFQKIKLFKPVGLLSQGAGKVQTRPRNNVFVYLCLRIFWIQNDTNGAPMFRSDSKNLTFVIHHWKDAFQGSGFYAFEEPSCELFYDPCLSIVFSPLKLQLGPLQNQNQRLGASVTASKEALERSSSVSDVGD